MPRRTRVTPGGLVYHVLNRTVAGLPLPAQGGGLRGVQADHGEAHRRHRLRIVAWCLMRNHWHFVVWPREEGKVTTYFRWLAHTHAMRWHVAHNTVVCIARNRPYGDEQWQGEQAKRLGLIAHPSPRRPPEGTNEGFGWTKLAASRSRRPVSTPDPPQRSTPLSTTRGVLAWLIRFTSAIPAKPA